MCKISFEYNLRTEAQNLYFCFYQAITGFYAKNGYLVTDLPTNKNSKPEEGIIYFPNLDWKKIINDNQSLVKKYKSELDHDFITHDKYEPIISSIQKELAILGVVEEYQMAVNKQINTLNSGVIEDLLKKINKAFPKLNVLNTHVKIHPKIYGSGGSFYRALYAKNNEVTITPRFDAENSSTLKILLSSFTRSFCDAENYTWKESEAVDFFLLKNVFDFDLTNYSTAFKIAQSATPSIQNKTLRYLASVGVPVGKFLHYQHKTNSLCLNGTDISNYFSRIEFRALAELLKEKGTTVNFDTLANVMYKTNADTKYSLWGITKVIQRIRDKLEKQGLPRSTIKSVSGEGFIIY